MGYTSTSLDRHKLSLIRKNVRVLLQYGNVMPFMWSSRFHTYLCFYCKALAMSTEALRDHVAAMHKLVDLDNILRERVSIPYECEAPVKLDVKDISCKLCDTTVASMPDLIGHLNHVHQAGYDTSLKDCFLAFELGEEKQKCANNCGLQFNYFESLFRHALKHHVEQNFSCTVCGKSFHRKMAVVAHFNDNHKQGGYPCDICGSMFKTASRRYHHNKTVHLTCQRECPECDEVCKSKYFLNIHLETAHGVKQCNYECRFCGKIFSQKSNMFAHVRKVHEREKNVVCTICGRKFFQKSHMMRHMQLHTEEEVCACDLCGKSFQTKDRLRYHLNRVHNNKDVVLVKKYLTVSADLF